MIRWRGSPLCRQNPNAIFKATSTLVDPLSEKNTCSRPGGRECDEALRDLLRRRVGVLGEYDLVEHLGLRPDRRDDLGMAVAVR